MRTGSYNKRLCKLGGTKLTLLQCLSSTMYHAKRHVYPNGLSRVFSVWHRACTELGAYSGCGEMVTGWGVSKKKKIFSENTETAISPEVGFFAIIGFPERGCLTCGYY